MHKLIQKLSKVTMLILAIFTLSACGFPGVTSTNSQAIRVAGLSTTEGRIIIEIVKQMIEHETDLTVDTINNLGTSVVLHQAVMNGDADITSVRYTGTEMAATLGMTPDKDPDKAMETVQKIFDEKFDMKYYDSYGFENTYAFMVTQETADKLGISKVSDLEKYKDEIDSGFDSQWLIREGDGYPGFVKEYGFELANRHSMQIGLVYDAVAAGKMDTVLGYSTDGRINSYNLVTLEDDRNFFPPYDASPAATKEILEKHPELDELLNRIVGSIDTETMQELNYTVDHKLKEPAIVAEEFLEAHNYFREEGA